MDQTIHPRDTLPYPPQACPRRPAGRGELVAEDDCERDCSLKDVFIYE